MTHLKKWRRDHPDDKDYMINARPSYFNMRNLETPPRGTTPKRLRNCAPHKIRNPDTRRCVNRSSAIGKKLSGGGGGGGGSSESCPPDKIRNPDTRRCVNRSSAIGKKLSGGGGGGGSSESCPPDKVRNPDTGRCVLRSGAVGKRILGVQKGKGPSRKANDLICIAIGEPNTEQYGVYLKVTKAFLKILRATTKVLKFEKGDDGNMSGGNAYVFGPKFPYDYEGGHRNEDGGTGIVIDDGGLNKYDSLKWLAYFHREPQNATEIEMTNIAGGGVSHKIIFMGYTHMGYDVGAEVFTHRNSRGEIDSLIIDSFYFEELRDNDSLERLFNN